jgi:hypothetical protein
MTAACNKQIIAVVQVQPAAAAAAAAIVMSGRACTCLACCNVMQDDFYSSD